MKNKKTYLAKAVYSLYTGLIMGFIITSGFLVIITNIDKYFFNSYIGINGDLLYYIATIFLIPIFGAIYVYNKRLVIENKILKIRENPLSFNISTMEVSLIKTISLHTVKRRRHRENKTIKITNGKTAFILYIRPFNSKTITLFLGDLIQINPDIIIDDYFKKIMEQKKY